MLASTHFLVGSAIGKASGNPLLAAVFGFGSHFLLDFIPHWDWGYHLKKTTRSFLIAGLDLFLGIGLVIWLIISRDFSIPVIINIFVGGIFSLLPDAVGIIIKFFKLKAGRGFLSFHKHLHWFDKNERDVFEWKEKKISPAGIFWGIIWQIPFVAFSIYLLLK